jgi:hypothetical protein
MKTSFLKAKDPAILYGRVKLNPLAYFFLFSPKYLGLGQRYNREYGQLSVDFIFILIR